MSRWAIRRSMAAMVALHLRALITPDGTGKSRLQCSEYWRPSLMVAFRLRADLNTVRCEVRMRCDGSLRFRSYSSSSLWSAPVTRAAVEVGALAANRNRDVVQSSKKPLALPYRMSLRLSVAVLILAGLIAGCGLRVYASNVLGPGPDRFSLSADGANVVGAQQAALEAAQAHCGRVAQEPMITDMRTATTQVSGVRCSIIFQCVPKGTSELKQAPP